MLWGDGVPESGETIFPYFLAGSQGRIIQLMFDEGLLAFKGGPIGLNQKVVIVQGSWLEAGTVLKMQSISLANREGGDVEGVFCPQPWVSILCKISDIPDEPKDMDYFMGMYSDQYPGLDHFWQQNSYGLANLEGSAAFSWFVLPHPREYYLQGGNLDWWTAAA
jgi:hypothetical protein